MSSRAVYLYWLTHLILYSVPRYSHKLFVHLSVCRFRRVLIECGVLEPLCSLARSEDVELEIQRYAVLAIASESHVVRMQ